MSYLGTATLWPKDAKMELLGLQGSVALLSSSHTFWTGAGPQPISLVLFSLQATGPGNCC